MARDILIRPRAREDVVEQALHITYDSPDAADRFVDAVDDALTMLAGMPEMGAARHFENPVLHGIRVWPVKGFEKHMVFYRPLDSGIDVFRILHAARDIEAVVDEGPSEADRRDIP